MSTLGQPERSTQDRVIALFRDEPRYCFLGDWTDRQGNDDIKSDILSDNLTIRGYKPQQVSPALDRPRTEAGNPPRTAASWR